ncbi:hypothetical protein [Microlunatus soli]|uniref:Uncharacterized protein n=1 Tax=Microlunatus soli TaxID=630515 RepID=A0A1H1Q7D3_9ACTN|nr:hypothetical protein [Microlunatus soli]SDS19187.1 hypothetical protein SAMN04489812_1162 [Microlunatus soli]
MDWYGTVLPVVPIELQLGTMIARDQQHRLRATLEAIDPSRLDIAMLRRTVADRQIMASGSRIPTVLLDLL